MSTEAKQTSTVKAYDVGFSPLQNCVLDNIASYLSSLSDVFTYNKFQWVRHGIEISIKIPESQAFVSEPEFNYVSIKNSDDVRTFYYYVNNIEQLAQNTIKVNLTLDTLNTFKDLLLFTNNTKIIRQHKDRFRQTTSTNTTFIRQIDRIPEVSGLTKYLQYDNKIYDSNDDYDQKWYLVYTNNNYGNEEENTAVNCYLVPGTGIDTTYTPPTTYTRANIEQPSYYFILDTNVTLTWSKGGTIGTMSTTGNTQYIRIDNDGSHLNLAYMSTTYDAYGNVTNAVNEIASDIDSFSVDIDCEGILLNDYYYERYVNDNLYYYINNKINTGSTTFYATTATLHAGIFSQINRTKTNIVRIIECPYLPYSYTDTLVWEYVLNTDLLDDQSVYWIRLKDLNTEFLHQTFKQINLGEFRVILPSKANRIGYTKDSNYESKLYHSDFYSFNLVYDSFVRNIPLENLSATSTSQIPYLNLDYKQSNTMTSNLAFKYTPVNATQDRVEDYERFLLCNRNNEVPVYNSSYLNYLRNGYNYDVKTKERQNIGNWLGTGLQFAGGVASLIGGIATSSTGLGAAGIAGGISLLTSAIGSTASNIASNIQAEQNIEQKIAEAKATTNSASGSDDLNILNYYNGNLLHYTKYALSSNQQNNIFELFYKTGYACSEAGVPNTSSRYYFNFLQCEPEFSTKSNPDWKQYINDVIVRFEKGVTYFHQYNDFNQTLENWETWLVE